MKTSRVTRRVVRRWALRIRQMAYGDLLITLRLAMPARDRRTLGALLAREVQRRVRTELVAAEGGYPCSVYGKPCPCGFDSDDCR